MPYIDLTELKRLGWNPKAFEDVDAPTRQEKIAARSDYIDGYLAAQFTLPLTTWGDDIRRCCAILASIDLIRGRGVGHEDREDIDKEEDRQDAWLKLIAEGKISPRVIDSTPTTVVGHSARESRVFSSSSRGLSVRGTGLTRGPFQGD